MADMDQKTTLGIKKEGADEDLDAVSMVQLYPSSSNIKEELEEDVYKEPVEEPLNTEEPSLHVKQDIELKQHVDGSEHKFVEDPLGICWSTDYLKEEPELHLEGDETENTMLSSTRCELNSTRLIQSTGESCGISLEETVNQGVVSNGLEIGAEDSAEIILSTTHTQRWTSEEGSLFGSNLKCTLREKFCRLIRSTGGSCGISLEETVNQGVVSSGLEIRAEDSAHIIMSKTHTQRGTSEEGSLLGCNLKCSLREKEFQIFSCSSCLQSFSSKYRLIMHVFIHINGVQPPSFVCKSCGEVFPSTITLNQHLNHVEGDKAKRNHKCDVCAKSFARLCDLKQHTLIHNRLKPHKCDLCGKSFTKLGYLKSHTLIHTGTRPHKCDVCGKSFNRLYVLKRHKLIHTGMKPHKCVVCAKSFARLCDLKQHTLIHNGMKSHKCDVCGKSFTWLGEFKRHTLIHSGMRPHTCDVCGKSFTLLGHLKRHTLIHTGMRPHTCDICGKSFTQLGALKTHTALHTVKNST